MDRNLRAHFEQVIARAHAHLTSVEIAQNDVTPRRAILEVHGTFRDFDVRIKEIFAASGNLYSYYLLGAGTVIVGWDNYTDLRVIKMKFGNQFKRHMDDLIPHRHGYGKKTVELTSGFTAEKFLERLEQFSSDV